MKNYTIGNVRFYGPKGMYVDYHELTVEPAPWQGDSRLDMSGKRNADDYVIYNKT